MTFPTKEAAFDAMEETRAEWIAAARAWIKQYARDGRIVNVNDLIAYGPKVPEGVDPRVRGVVFAEKGVWEYLGYTKSARKISHGRPVAMFRLVGTNGRA